jgi:trk system potassium uptake protein
MRAVIVGCGRVGARVATRLAKEHEVTVVDWNPDSFDRLGSDFPGETVIGNGIDVDVLRLAQVGTCDVFFAVTDGDNRNLMAAQIARSLGAAKSIARVYDATRSQVFDETGLITFSPTVLGAERLHAMVVREWEAE